ncbi:hypothetical protein TL16_g03999 [Triparma laevis f. inornata]|uniref:4-hydroxy-tetrahydrodipicolinate reductase n=1 Tax=Triparma laevis f. inornata TaxID=1714386 RepID=A0A9W7A712_9STRA|nr:hypothetical protein TL16_g03999 [Triparma laevis f. inornata]
MDLCPFAITGPDMSPQTITVTDPDTKRTATVNLIPSSDMPTITSLLPNHQPNLIAIDYTHPSAVNSNADYYAKNKIPFVMGTTGGDRDALISSVTEPKPHYCVIAPNMGKQIVAMQYALTTLEEQFPGAFQGYNLEVVESHQKKKADTSGTAVAVIGSIKGMIGEKDSDGFRNPEDVVLLRDDKSSSDFGVPSEYLDAGHAFHTYTLTSGDGSVEFELKHNVCGRRVYADGTADAVKFLRKVIGEKGGGGGEGL